MRGIRKIALAMFLTSMVTLVGCGEKKVELTFTNFTERQLEVSITGPGDGTGMIGAMNGLGGRVSTELKVKKNDLPAQYQWSAGPNNGRFTISKKTEKKLWIDVGTKHAPRDKNTEIIEHREKIHQKVTQEEVVR